MYLHIVPDQWTNTNFGFDCYSYPAHSQMWSSLHWRNNCSNADATSGALRPAILHVREYSRLVYQEPMTRIVSFVFWKVFVRFPFWEFWIEISLVWCILAVIVADYWIVWVYVQVNYFCTTLIRWRMATHAIFNRCYCTAVTLTLITQHFGYHSIWFGASVLRNIDLHIFVVF